jgi:hypothetical protein
MVPIYNSLNEGYGGAKLTAERRLEPDGEDFRIKSQSLGGGTFSSDRRFEFRRFDRLDGVISCRVQCSSSRALWSTGFDEAIVRRLVPLLQCQLSPFLTLHPASNTRGTLHTAQVQEPASPLVVIHNSRALRCVRFGAPKADIWEPARPHRVGTPLATATGCDMV